MAAGVIQRVMFAVSAREISRAMPACLLPPACLTDCVPSVLHEGGIGQCRWYLSHPGDDDLARSKSMVSRLA